MNKSIENLYACAIFLSLLILLLVIGGLICLFAFVRWSTLLSYWPFAVAFVIGVLVKSLFDWLIEVQR